MRDVAGAAEGSFPDRRAPPDEELASRAAAGNHEAFAALMERYQRQVYLYCLRSTGDPWDAVELANETFYRAWRALAHYDPARPWRPWLFRIAVNLCRKHHQSRAARRAWEQPLERLPPSQVEVRDPLQQPELSTLFRAELAQVRAALSTLPPGQRQVTLLYYGLGFDYREIGEILGVPLGTVATWLHRARERLRQALHDGRGVDATASFGTATPGTLRFGRTR